MVLYILYNLIHFPLPSYEINKSHCFSYSRANRRTSKNDFFLVKYKHSTKVLPFTNKYNKYRFKRDVLYFHQVFPFQSKPCHPPFMTICTDIGLDIISVKWDATGNRFAVFFESQFLLYERKQGTPVEYNKILHVQTLQPWLDYEWIPGSIQYDYRESVEQRFPFYKKSFKGPVMQPGLFGILILCKNGRLYCHQKKNEFTWNVMDLVVDKSGKELQSGAITLSMDQKITLIHQDVFHSTHLTDIQCNNIFEMESCQELNCPSFQNCRIVSDSQILVVLDSKVQLWKRDASSDFFSNSDIQWNIYKEHTFPSSIACWCMSNDMNCMSF